MKVASQFPVLDNRPIDQWKAMELKQELKRRKLSTRGLKEELIKRLDEAIREENESTMENSDEDVGRSPQPIMLHGEDAGTVSDVIETAVDMMNDGNKINEVEDGSPQPILQTEDAGTVFAVKETTVDMMGDSNKINKADDGSTQPMLLTTPDMMNDGSEINKVDDESPQTILQAEDAGTVSAVIETTGDAMNDVNKINRVDDDSLQPMLQAEDGWTVLSVIETTMVNDDNRINNADDGSPQAMLQVEDAGAVSSVIETNVDVMNDDSKINKVDDGSPQLMLQTEEAGTVSAVIETTVDMINDDGSPQPMLQAEDARTVSAVIETTLDVMNDGYRMNKVDDGSPQPMPQAEDAGAVLSGLETTVDMMNDGNKISKVDDGSRQPMLQTEETGTVSSVTEKTVHVMIDGNKISKIDDGSPQPMPQTEDAGTVPYVIERTVDMMNDGNKINNVIDGCPQPMLQAEDGGTVSAIFETTVDTMNDGNKMVDGGINDADIDDTSLLLGEVKVQEVKATRENNCARDGDMVLNVTCGEAGVLVEGSVVSYTPMTLPASQKNDSQNGMGDSKSELEYEIKPFDEAIELNSSDRTNQVSEVRTVLGFQVKSDSISTDCVLTNETIELKDNIIVDNDKLELDVKPEMVQPSSSNVLPDGGKLHPMYVELLHENKLPSEEEDGTRVANSETSNKNESAHVSSEKLILDRSSGDDSMEEDALESRQIVSNHNSDEVVDMKETMEVSVVEEAPADVSQDDIHVDNKDIQKEDNDPIAALTVKTNLHDVVSSEKLNLDRSSGDNSIEEEDALGSNPMVSKFSADEVVDRKAKTEITVVEDAPAIDVQDHISVDNEKGHDEFKNAPAAPTVKRSLHDQELIVKNDTPKRQRRWWNSENLRVSEPESSIASHTIPEDVFPSTSLKRNFARFNSAAIDDAPKEERIVPPSPKPPTDSLRIDRFLRPFTIKAVQELLRKTGTVSRFWMDPIKTHCYVTYSSSEEATDTRNSIYNLQWPTNGGRLLVAEFVDPEEVKIRVEASPSAPVTPSPQKLQSQPSPRQMVQKEKLPPPPPLSNPLQARERLSLPPPPQLTEKVDTPIVTLDDLFKKTKATPRIYYLPLSEEKVAEKLKAKQSSRDFARFVT